MLSAMKRPKVKQLMNDYQFDLLVIGGGITGAGIALDAATRGLKVALVEMQDFAAGTSSRSTKLVHGGLRYLKQFEIKIVSETGKERAIVYNNARHVTEPERMLLPFYKGGTFGPLTTSLGLAVYDRLAGVKRSERRKMLSPKETLEKEPLLKSTGLRGGGSYVEYRTDDARLTIEVMKKAAEKGALCLNYMKADRFLYEGKKAIGAVVIDRLTGKEIEIHAETIVNATGPWVDKVREKDEISNNKRLTLTKGVHLVIDQKDFPLGQAIYFDAPDGRMIFAIPRGDKAYIGTTDTVYTGDRMKPVATEKDITYLLEALHFIFPTANVGREQVESTWAGVRPLIYEEGKDPSEISRKDEIWIASTGVMTIAGGKLTGYRKMAEEIVNLVMKKSTKKFKKSITKQLPLSGGDFTSDYEFEKYIQQKANEGLLYGLHEEDGAYLARFYGRNVDQLFTYLHGLEDDALPAVLRAEILYGIHFEMAMTPADFLIRRTGALFFNMPLVETYGEAIIQYMAQVFPYTEEEKNQYRKEVQDAIMVAKGR